MTVPRGDTGGRRWVAEWLQRPKILGTRNGTRRPPSRKLPLPPLKGTLLDVGEDHDPEDIDDDDPMAGEHHLYMFLSWLLDHAVSASMGE